MKRDIIPKYTIDNNLYVDTMYVFTNDCNKYSFLINKNGCSMIVSEELLDSIKNKTMDDNLIFKLIQHGLAWMKNPRVKIKRDNNKNIYFIIDVTKRCNFNCLYCFRNLNDNRVIENDKLKDICDYILKIVTERKLKNVTIQVWGGEPVLAFEKLEYVYNYFKDTNIRVKIDIETNGSLITQELAKKLYDMNVNIGVSLDGLEKHQDIQRRLVNNNSSNDLVKKGISNLKKYYGNDIGGITVVTKYNYKDVAEIINYFANELGIRNMKFNIVKDNPNANEDSIGLTLEQVREFASKLFDVQEVYNAMGIFFNEGNIQMRKGNLLERNNSSYCISNGCKGGINLLSIDMNGNIYPCELMDYDVKIGSIYDNGYLANNKDLVKQIREHKKTNKYFKKKVNKECNNCPWYYFCKGGCSSRVLYSEGKMTYDEIECEFNKVIYEKIIDQLLKQIKG